MNKLKTALIAALLAGTSVGASDADAHGRSRASVGIWFGPPAPFYYYHPRPYYYHPRPYYYYPPTVVVPAPAAPPVYIEQPQATAPATADSGAYWYYCRDTQTYYPYVQQCASPWERVTPGSAPAS